MSERLTRKEIKHDIREDEVQHVLHRVFQVLIERPRIIVGAIVGFIVLVLALTGLFAYLDSRRAEASSQLAEAMKIAGAPVVADGESSADPDERSFPSEEDRNAEAKRVMEEVRSGVGSSVAGDVAGLYLADIAASEGDADTAREIWQSFLAEHDDHVLAISVRLNLIHLDRENGRAQEVADELQQELNSAVKTLPEDLLLFELAQTLESLDREDEAVDLYQRILDDHPRSPYSQKARQATTAAG